MLNANPCREVLLQRIPTLQRIYVPSGCAVLLCLTQACAQSELLLPFLLCCPFLADPHLIPFTSRVCAGCSPSLPTPVAFGMVLSGPHCFLELSSAGLIAVLVPGCCWAYSSFSEEDMPTATMHAS